MAKAVKLADIAERLGVSTVTVSKALSDQKGVSEEVRAKIKKMAADMGYISPSAARIQSEKRSYNIGVLVSSKYFDQTQSFYWLMYQELATKALNKNCFTMLEVVQEDEEKNQSVPKLLEGNRINGLVIIGLMDKEYLRMVSNNARVPVVYLDFYSTDIENDSVVSDNYYGMYQMTAYLCSLGHRKIAYVGTLFATDSITDRYFGYCKALYENGIEVRKDYVLNDREAVSGSSAKDFTEGFPHDMPTAFACNCDVTALRVIDELNKIGYRVPEDVSVVGYDDYAFQNSGEVELTTYAVDVKEMARKAIKILLRKMNGEIFNKGVTTVTGKMIVRSSAKEV